MERWKFVPGSLKYEVSDQGRVRHIKRILSPRLFKNGYLNVQLPGKQAYVHRLVLSAFIGTIPEGYEVNHLNGNKTDNKLKNLECVTPHQNSLHYHLPVWYVNQIRLPGFEWFAHSTGHIPEYCK